MTFGQDRSYGDRPTPPSSPGKKRSALVPTLIVVAVLVVGFVFFSQIYADILWYNQLGYLEVFLKENGTRIAIFLIAFLIMGLAVYFSLRVAYRSRPVYAPDSSLQDNLNRYQQQLEPVRRLLMIGIPVVLAGFAGTAAASAWQTVLLFFNQQPFGQSDPQFGLDYSFYMNTLPFLGFITGFLVSVVLIAGIAGLLTHYLYGGIRLEDKGFFASTAAKIHMAVFAALFLILQGINYWLDRYATRPVRRREVDRCAVHGCPCGDSDQGHPGRRRRAGGHPVHRLGVRRTLAPADRGHRDAHRDGDSGRRRLPVDRAAVPGGTQRAEGRSRLHPTEYSADPVGLRVGQDRVHQLQGKLEAEAGALRKDAETTANIRLLDPNLVSDAFAQLEQFRQYYQFDKTLNVDRYKIKGEVQDTVIAVRELNTAGVPAGWVNEHLALHAWLRRGGRRRCQGRARRKTLLPALRHPDPGRAGQ